MDAIPKKEAEETVESKELSFKLDEPITTALNIRPFVNVKEEDSLSFVVLGKDSVEAQASLLASYVDIQQKSMSIVSILQFYFISRLTIYFKVGSKNLLPSRITNRWCHLSV